MKSRWNTHALIGCAMVLGLAGLGPSNAAGEPEGGRFGLDLGVQQVPKQSPPDDLKGFSSQRGTNPWIGLLSNPEDADYYYWRQAMKQGAAKRAVSQQLAKQPLIVDEREPSGTSGSNDTRATAQLVRGFGVRDGRNPKARVLGAFASAPPAAPIEPSVEDDGAIPLAAEVDVSDGRQRTTTGSIGDGPHGSAGDGTGDFDFYAIPDLARGQTLLIDTDVDDGALDSVVALWTSAGAVVAVNDDGGDGSLASRLRVSVPEDGDYYVSVSGFGSDPVDPFDSASGTGTGSEGDYTVTLGPDVTDVDMYAVNLRAGDVLGGTVSGSSNLLTVFGPGGRELVGSAQDVSFIYPAASPLPGGGNTAFAHVAARTGRHVVAFGGDESGRYDGTLEVYRSGSDSRNATQTLFVDFDGARLNTGIFGGAGVRTLSPLSAFLGRWGLAAADEDALIDQVLTTVRENIVKDFADTGVKVRIRNSRDHADPFGKPNVSRLIVGGTIDESGVSTIGIAESIDPGNFEAEETALILLDLVSEAAGESYSFNTYLTSGSDRIKFIGTALGNITSHEAGHYVGSFHVDQFNDRLNLMDQGGNFPLLYGVGADGVGGSADDPDVDFGEDTYNPGEGFTGTEDTAANTKFALFNPLERSTLGSGR
jgi:hypothetical protein